MKKLILSVAVVGTALMGQGVEAQNRDPLVDAVRDSNAAITAADLEKEVKLLKEIADLLKFINESSEEEEDDSIQGAILADRKKYEQALDRLDTKTDEVISIVGQPGVKKASCSIGNKKQLDALTAAATSFDSDSKIMPPIVERKRDKVRRKTREAINAAKSVCGLK